MTELDRVGNSDNFNVREIPANKTKTDSLRAVNILMRTGMSHTAVSVTLWTWQHAAKENYCYFAIFNGVVNTKTSIIQRGANNIKRWLENESKPINLNLSVCEKRLWATRKKDGMF